MKPAVLQGMLGKAIARSIKDRFLTVDYALLEEPFRLRNETDNAWRCEFWGKIVRSAVTAAVVTDNSELKNILKQTVNNIMATQTADGCISSYPAELQLNGWDVWGRKYVLLALIRYYEMLDRDPAVLDCCCRMLDHLMMQVGPEEGKRSILACGLHSGLATASILGAVTAMWRLTGKKEYRTFADYIIDSGFTALGNVLGDIAVGIRPSALGNGKAYELTSCLQGVAEMELLAPVPGRKALLQRYYEQVRDLEIFVTGVGGSKDLYGEYWFDGALRQTRPGKNVGLGETCVTATWIHYCMDMLQLTDDAKIVDELEKSLYNGILGAMAPDNSHWMHVNPTPLTGGGSKSYAVDQIGNCFKTPFGGNDCCRAQGPEGLVASTVFAVAERDGTLTVNLFEPLECEFLKISGNYPAEPTAEINFTKCCSKTLRLRTPDFLEKVFINGEEIAFEKGSYLAITRDWTLQDKITMNFDFSLQEIFAPDGSAYVAVKRGPLVLAADSRGTVPSAVVNTVWNNTLLCDYASAGNLFDKENHLTVWFKK